MRKLVMWNLMTLDGLFEGPKRWDLDFHQAVWGDELEALSLAQLDGAGALLFGRVTYEGMAAYWKSETGAIAERMNALPKVVASRTLAHADWNNTRVVDDAVPAVRALKAEGDDPIYVFGSADLSSSLLRAGLFDEIRLCVAPLVLGDGVPLWKRDDRRRPMELLEARPLRSGAVIVRYRPAGA